MCTVHCTPYNNTHFLSILSDHSRARNPACKNKITKKIPKQQHKNLKTGSHRSFKTKVRDKIEWFEFQIECKIQ